MIASLAGRVSLVGLDAVVVEVGGVGMRVLVTPGTAASLHAGDDARLATSLVVREDSLTLYGFAADDERDLFEQVQTVSGVGPRLALAMLAVHAPDDLRGAITGGDLVALTKVPGIGRKGAERIVLELRDRVTPPAASTTLSGGPDDGRPVASGWQSQVREALVGLGYPARQADDAVEAVAPAAVEGASVSALLRAALQELGR